MQGKIAFGKDVVSGEEVQYTYDSLNRLIAASTTAASDAGTTTPALRARHRALRFVGELAGQGEVEGRPLARFGLHPDATTGALDNLPADSQSEAASGKLRSVQALERLEDPLLVLPLNPHAVVAEGK